MKGSLERLLRVRRLKEEISRTEYSQWAAHHAWLESSMRAARKAAIAVRREAAAALVIEDAQPGLWRRTLEDGEMGERQAMRWEEAARQQASRTAGAREEFLADRGGRMQVEILLQEKAARQKQEDARREQQAIDDWFGVTRAAQKGRKSDRA